MKLLMLYYYFNNKNYFFTCRSEIKHKLEGTTVMKLVENDIENINNDFNELVKPFITKHHKLI